MKMFKVMVLGDIGVGKTALVRRAVTDRFETDYKATIGCEITRHAVRAADGGPVDVDLVLWDTDGNLGDAILRHGYLKGAAAAIIVADASRRQTIADMYDLAIGFLGVLPGRPLLQLLNKIDLLDAGEFDRLPEQCPLGERVWATSAKTGQHVHDAFRSLAITLDRRSD